MPWAERYPRSGSGSDSAATHSRTPPSCAAYGVRSDDPAAGRERRAPRRPAPRSTACPSRRSSTVHRSAGSWVERWTASGAPSGSVAGELGRQRARGVHHDQVALVEERRQFDEGRVHDRAVAAPGHHHAHRVAGEAAGFWRRARLERRRQLEARARPPGSARRGRGRWSSAPPPPRPPSVPTGLGRRRSVREASSAATTSSGSGRSLMSSPGNASWCIWVRMSPGSTAQTRSPGSSAASTALRWSSAAFEEP